MRQVEAQPRHRGISLIYAIVAMSALMALCSLGVDLGRVQVAKTELQRAADAAARYAVTGIADSSYVSKAQAAAADNTCDGNSVSLLSSDIQLGTWANSTFTPGGTSPNAIRVTANRIASRNNAIPLMFGQILGLTSCNVKVVAVATIASGDGDYGFVGISSVNMLSNSNTDSYNSSIAPYSAGSADSKGGIASDGDITLSGKSNIQGDVNPGPNGTLSTTKNVSISGSTTNLPSNLSYPNVDASPYATTNNNSSISSQFLKSGDLKVNSTQTLDLSSGTYYFNDVTINGNSNLNINGNVTMYVTGNFTFSGHAATSANLPANFRIFVQGAGTVKVNGTADLYADIYAPEADVTVGSNADLYGAVIGNTLKITGSGGLHYDESLGTGDNTTTPSSIATVQ